MESKDLMQMNSIQHPLHPNHSLTFLKGLDLPWYFICNGCREVKSAASDAAFGCKECEFYLDLKCAALMDDFFSKHDREAYEEIEQTANEFHFSHGQHHLRLCRLTESVVRSCFYCRTDISDYVYCCLICDFFIHKFCMDEMKEEVNHAFHPQHLLQANTLAKDKLEYCRACRGYDIQNIGLSCQQCEFHLHYSCAREPFVRAIKFDHHDHSLYYFGGDAGINDFTCELCSSKDKGAVYRCLECSWSKHGNFHVKCSFLQNKVKHNSHACDLTLSDSVREVIKGHDTAEYFCDICEKPGNSRHHVYGCEKCNFIAHIECAISKDEVPKPGPRSDDEAEEIGDESDDQETTEPVKFDAGSDSTEVISDSGHGWDPDGSSSQAANNIGRIDPAAELRLKVDELQEEMKQNFNQIQDELKQMRELFKQSMSSYHLTEAPAMGIIDSIKSNAASEATSTGIKIRDAHGYSSQGASNHDHADPTRELKLKIDELQEEMKKCRNMLEEMNRPSKLPLMMKESSPRFVKKGSYIFPFLCGACGFRNQG